MVWHQFFVRSIGPAHHRSLLELIDKSLHYRHAFIVTSYHDGPIQGQDGTWEVRVGEEASTEQLEQVKAILKRENLEIVREVRH